VEKFLEQMSLEQKSQSQKKIEDNVKKSKNWVESLPCSSSMQKLWKFWQSRKTSQMRGRGDVYPRQDELRGSSKIFVAPPNISFTWTIYTRTYIHTYIHSYTYIHTNTHTYIHTYKHTYIHTNTHTYILLLWQFLFIEWNLFLYKNKCFNLNKL
jgi:hypothetical protein